MNFIDPVLPEKPALLFLLFAALATFTSGNAEPGRATQTDAIISGVAASPGSQPWMVALVRNTTRTDLPLRKLKFCGGTLIDPSWVLTAAHCVLARSISDMSVVIGVTDLDQTGVALDRVTQIVVHPFYNDKSYVNDIALLRLETPSSQPPIELFTELSDVAVAGFTASVHGWGRTYVARDDCTPLFADSSVNADQFDCKIHDFDPLSRPFQAALLTVELRLMTDAECTARIQDLIESITGARNANAESESGIQSHICVYDPEEQRGVCFGDSGGPLVLVQDGEGLLAGITSYIIGSGACTRLLGTDVFTKVAYYLDFIEEVTGTDPSLGFEHFCPPAVLPVIEYSTVSNQKSTVRIHWTPYAAATSYTLRYAAYPNPAGAIESVSLDGSLSEISEELAAGSSFYVSLQTHNANCSGPMSNPLIVQVPQP